MAGSGMVVAPQVPAVEAGVEVLRAGGNAFDAAVSAAFVQMVHDPQQCGVAGFGVALVRTASGEEKVIDFNGVAGSLVEPEMWSDIFIEQDWTGYGYHLQGALNMLGYQAIMTPGTIAGMAEVLSRYGTLDWATALRPAITAAEAGTLITPEMWRWWNLPGLGFNPALKYSAESRRLFLKPDGSTLAPGDRLLNTDYAATLRRLADAGPDDFYRGELAARMAEDLAANGAFVTADDLAAYRVRVTDPLRINYRGHEILTTPPASGGICLAQVLKIVADDDLGALGFNSVEYIDLVGHAMKAAFHDWYALVGDPTFVDVPVDLLLSDDHARQWRARIANREPFQVPLERVPQHTTHITVVDGEGNCAAITHSLSMPSGAITPGLGFMWNAIMNAANPVPGRPNSIAPRKSRLTGICPTIAKRDGEPVVVLGSPGGTRIITGVLQTLLNVLDHGMTAVEAVSAPRFDCQSDKLDCESRIPRRVRAELAGRGFEIVPDTTPYSHWASVQLIKRDPRSGRLDGGADPRDGGADCSARCASSPATS